MGFYFEGTKINSLKFHTTPDSILGLGVEVVKLKQVKN